MLLNPLPSSFELAGQRTLTVLLNCYLREYAEPRGAVRPACELEVRSAPHTLRQLQASGCQLLRLDFPASEQACLLAVKERRSNYRFRSQPYLLTGQVLDWKLLAERILDELGREFGPVPSQELLEQIGNSFRRLQQFYAHPPQPRGDAPLDWFVHAEQSLTGGHSHHPAPKSREGMDDEELFRYSPELQAEFRPFFFRAHPGVWMQRGESVDLGLGQERLLPVHPWQAGFLLRNPWVQRAIDGGWLEPLGCQGEAWTATSSVRTLFRRGFPWFLKLSLHMRLTNCLRKNAWYELESALLLNNILRELPQPFERFHILAEPGYTTVDLPHAQTEERLFLREAFSTLFRDSAPVQNCSDPVIMAAGLFAGATPGGALERFLPADSDGQQKWFGECCRAVLWPALFFYAEHGVIFEPHLQNTLLRLSDGMPSGSFYRDLEGTKLLGNVWAERLSPGTVTDSVLYTPEQAWQRFAYCLIFNQLAEVVDRLEAVPVAQLWAVARASLGEYLERHGSDRSAPAVQRLLSESSLPLKANLTTRFLRLRDRQASYVPVPNPLRL
jgi:siderophore synthetase component